MKTKQLKYPRKSHPVGNRRRNPLTGRFEPAADHAEYKRLLARELAMLASDLATHKHQSHDEAGKATGPDGETPTVACDFSESASHESLHRVMPLWQRLAIWAAVTAIAAAVAVGVGYY